MGPEELEFVSFDEKSFDRRDGDLDALMDALEYVNTCYARGLRGLSAVGRRRSVSVRCYTATCQAGFSEG